MGDSTSETENLASGFPQITQPSVTLPVIVTVAMISTGVLVCECDPARRPGLLLRVGRAARRPRAARPPGAGRRRCGAGRELRGEGVRGAHADAAEPGPGALPAGDRGATADVGLHEGEPAGL